MTEVVAALIWEGDRFLACQRPAHKDRGLLWEFAGGKVEAGETKAQALVRECREELGIVVDVGDMFMEVTHSYPDLTIRLTLFHASIAEGVPRPLEHRDLRWVTVREMDALPFCPADAVILERLRGYDRAGAIREELEKQLFALQDPGYRAFHCRLVPTLDPDTVIGVRTPALRQLAKDYGRTPDAAVFLDDLPHRYYEENSLHGMLLSAGKDFDAVTAGLDRFLPYVDNWAVCDLISPKVFKKHLDELLPHIRRWLASGHIYTVRFAVGTLMRFYLDEAFLPEYPALAAAVPCEEYYISMMVSWYFATALAKQYDAVLPYLEARRLEPRTHNRAIQKAIESDRIPPERKAYLRTLKVKTA